MLRTVLSIAILAYLSAVLATPLPQSVQDDDDIFDILGIDPFGLMNLTRSSFSINILDPVLEKMSGVSYWVNSVGQAVQYGDMVWGPEELLLSMETTEDPGEEFYIDFNITFTIDNVKRSFGIPKSIGWKDGIIRYRFRSTIARDAHEKGVNAAIAEWKSWAPYLIFKLEPIKDAFERDIATISSIPNDGCHSNLAWSRGTSNDQKQINFDPTWAESDLKRAYVHELGHQLGLIHEHMRPDRNKYVKFDCSAVQATDVPEDKTCNRNTDCCKFPKSACCYAWMSNFEVWDPKNHLAGIYGTYDYSSVMHYASDYFAKKGQATLTKASVPFGKEEQAIAQGKTYLPISYHVSRGDAVAACGIYPDLCKKCFPNGVPATNPKGKCQ